QGCKFALKADKTTYEEGELPIFEIAATNTTRQDVKATVWVNVTAVAPTNPMSRMLPRPRSLWSKEVTFSLEPGETKTQKVACEAKLPAGESVAVTLGDRKETLLLRNFPVTNGGNAVNRNAANYVSPAGRK
ncbi:MAG TPA: hypothetical protein VFW33_08965, partial [Gemmataceae bacterium]|nr:hypothetical protein [Gemmataceae bacterium]